MLELISEAERQRLLALAMAAVPRDEPPDDQLLDIINKISGTDTQLVALRAYPSRTKR